MDEQRLETYLKTLDRPLTPFLEKLCREARKEGVPIIRDGMMRVLRVLLELKKPKSVLEIGTAVGFSAVFFCTYSDARVTTIENFPPRIVKAVQNIEESGYKDRISLLAGEAEEILPQTADTFDMIFLDAAQGQYISFLPELKRLLAPGGVLISDNVLKGGEILESRFAVERRNRTIHKRLREYLEALCADDDLVTVILPVGDGASVTVKKEPSLSGAVQSISKQFYI